ncbi:MAG TPA: hypothetical protein VF422_04730, partial [Dokdonella sp.]
MSVATTRFRLVDDWPAVQPDAAQAVTAFWLAERAFDQEAQVAQRLPQLVAHALAPDGTVAGVCTAYATTPPQLGQPMYYWRCFIGARWRSTPLVMQLLKHSCRVLERHARDNGFPCIGVLLELENTRFRDRGRA